MYHYLGYHRTVKLPPCPQASPSTHAYSPASEFALVDGPLGNASLALDTVDDSIELRLYHDTSYNHFSQCCVECFEIEDEIQLAHVLEQAVKRLHEDLDEI